jgi:hypothetical protein
MYSFGDRPVTYNGGPGSDLAPTPPVLTYGYRKSHSLQLKYNLHTKYVANP